MAGQTLNAGTTTPLRELSIEIWPRGYDWWHGTSAQLEAEGLIPKGFDWPKGKEHRGWTSGEFNFWLLRCRPEGHKGPQSSWLTIDNWSLRRTLAAHAGDGFAAARLHEKKVALAEELWRQTHEAHLQSNRSWNAYQDTAYQAFRARIVPQPPRRGRPSRSQG